MRRPLSTSAVSRRSRRAERRKALAGLASPGAETLLIRGATPGPPGLPPEAREAPQGRPPAREAR
jgi:hypothetical protein